MLETQKYLQSNSLDQLVNEFSLNTAYHASLPLVILNYDQINSTPKTHPIVRECRGLVLNSEDYSLVARSFPRFFNFGENQDEMKSFDFSNFIVEEKVDGSLCLIYYFDGNWHANTRGSFGLANIGFETFTWRDAFCQAMKVDNLNDVDKYLDRNLSYVCEFVSPWNKVVQYHPKPKLILLSTFCGEEETSWVDLKCPYRLFASTPEVFYLNSIEKIQEFLSSPNRDTTFEGIVSRDRNNLRFKWKRKEYLALHAIRGEGDNLFNPKYILPFVINGERDELLTYFPEVTDKFNEVESKVKSEFDNLEKVWNENRYSGCKKEFAQRILGKTKFTGILFNMYDKKENNLSERWRQSGDLILKMLFK